MAPEHLSLPGFDCPSSSWAPCRKMPPSPSSLPTHSPLWALRPWQPQQPLKPFPQGSSGSGKSRGGLLREGTGNPDPGGCLSAGTQVTGEIGGVVGAGVRRRLSHGYSSACLWGLAWRVAGNRTQRHAGHRDCVSYGGSWVPWGWRYLGPAQCRNCGTGEGIRMSCPFSSRRSQSIR